MRMYNTYKGNFVQILTANTYSDYIYSLILGLDNQLQTLYDMRYDMFKTENKKIKLRIEIKDWSPVHTGDQRLKLVFENIITRLSCFV